MTFQLAKIGESAKIKKIAITGIVGSGKSTVCDLLTKEGAYVIKSDEVVHQLYSQNQEIRKEIQEQFGSEMLLPQGVNRVELAKLVFHDRDALRRLQQIVHPHLIKVLKETYQKVKEQDYSAFIVEIPLLFEIEGLDTWFDQTIAITSDEDLCRKRFEKSHPDGHFQERLLAQLPQEEKCRRADMILENNGSLKELKSKVFSMLNPRHL